VEQHITELRNLSFCIVGTDRLLWIGHLQLG
jgi:hypothetical protein